MGRMISSTGNLYGQAATPVSPSGLTNTQTVASPQTNANGVTNSSAVGIPITQVFPQLYGSVLSAPLLWLFGLIGLLVVYKLIEEHRGAREDFAEIKLGLNNIVKIGLSAVIFIVVAKFLFTRYQVPGLSPIFKAA